MADNTIRLLVISTAGTIFQRFSPQANSMLPNLAFQDVLPSASVPPSVKLDYAHLDVRSGAELSFDTVGKVRDLVVSKHSDYEGVLLVTGTDTMDEFAFCLSLLLDGFLQENSLSFVVTGSMKPFDIPGFDGTANIVDSIKVLCSMESHSCGVLLVMNDTIHLPRYVQKYDSQLIGAFQSHPGPLGQLRGGSAIFYYLPPPCPFHKLDFLRLDMSTLKMKVCIWTITVNSFLPEAMLQDLDGLVLAGPGTGSLPAHMQQQLSPKWTSTMPIVVTSRCHVGNNFDDHYYKGSKHKYESQGFILSGFEQLSPVQACNLLIFLLSSGGLPARKSQSC